MYFLYRKSPRAPLIPKLRGHFAEFLNNASPAGLWILSSTTCVGLRYGHVYRNSSFSRQCGFTNFATFFHYPSHFKLFTKRICLLCTLCAWPGFSIPWFCYPPVSLHLLNIRGTGISTCYPSTTTFVLALGPDLPWEDQLYPGNLSHPAYMILTYISLLIPAFSLIFRPPCLSALASSYYILLLYRVGSINEKLSIPT